MTIDVESLVSDLYVVAEGHAVHPATLSDTREHIDAAIRGSNKSDTDIITEKASGRGAPGQEPPIPRGMPSGGN
jgi:hypothetical protein